MNKGTSWDLPAAGARDPVFSLAEHAQSRELLERRRIVIDCGSWITSHKRGPMYWLRNLTATENYHWQRDGLDPIMPFPFMPFLDRKIDVSNFSFDHDFGKDGPCEMCGNLGFEHCVPDYLDVTMGFLLLKMSELLIPKSREMMTSWIVVGFLTWYCQFFPQTQAFSQSESREKSQGNIEYANILYRNQMPWMKAMYPLKSVHKEQGSKNTIAWEHSSEYSALPRGIRKLTSKHPTVYFMDEAAHIPEAEATINIAKPCVPQIIMVSSVAPGWFADVCGV
jgi:hypothetical protein